MTQTKRKAEIRESVYAASRQLMLSGTMAQMCEDEATPTQAEFLLSALNAELAHREASKQKRLISRAGFPAYKTFEGYGYGCVKFRRRFRARSLSRPAS